MPSKSVTLTTDTAAYVAGDLLADTQLLSANVGRSGSDILIERIVVVDDDDQGQPLDLIFLNAATSLGTENGVPNISDANILARIVAQVAILAADFADLGGAKRADKNGINLPFQLAADGSLYIAAITRGTPTHTATGLKVTVFYKYR